MTMSVGRPAMARRRRTDHEAGAIAVEFVLILIVSLMLFAPVGEFSAALPDRPDPGARDS